MGDVDGSCEATSFKVRFGQRRRLGGIEQLSGWAENAGVGGGAQC
jgi:hypothetical protein